MVACVQAVAKANKVGRGGGVHEHALVSSSSDATEYTVRRRCGALIALHHKARAVHMCHAPLQCTRMAPPPPLPRAAAQALPDVLPCLLESVDAEVVNASAPVPLTPAEIAAGCALFNKIDRHGRAARAVAAAAAAARGGLAAARCAPRVPPPPPAPAVRRRADFRRVS